MKRTITIMTASIFVMMTLGCELEPTRPNLKDVYSVYTVETTGGYGFVIGTVYSNLSNALPSGLNTTVDEYVLNFRQGSGYNELKGSVLSLDLLKITEKNAFEAQLRKTVIFSGYGNDGETVINKPAFLIPLYYNVIEWKDYQAKIKFTGLTEYLSGVIEVRIDPAELTHHGGIRFDLNGDGIFDEYDTWTKQITLTGGESGSYPPYNYQQGLIAGMPSFSEVQANGFEPFTVKASFNTIPNFDTTNYSADGYDLNKYFILQKFNREKGWEKTGIKAIYQEPSIPAAVGDKEFRFLIQESRNGDLYRVKFENYHNAVNHFKAGASNYGIRQKLFGAWNPSIGSAVSDVFLTWMDSADGPHELKASEAPLFYESSSWDAHSKNVTFVMGVTLSVAGENGLPDPNGYIKNGIIKIGYLPSPSSVLSASDWNKIVYFPNDSITVETYQNDGDENKTINRWRVILPPEYKRNAVARQHYFFINNEYWSLGDFGIYPTIKPRPFGDIRNTNLILKEGWAYRTGYRAYPITNEF